MKLTGKDLITPISAGSAVTPGLPQSEDGIMQVINRAGDIMKDIRYMFDTLYPKNQASNNQVAGFDVMSSGGGGGQPASQPQIQPPQPQGSDLKKLTEAIVLICENLEDAGKGNSKVGKIISEIPFTISQAKQYIKGLHNQL